MKRLSSFICVALLLLGCSKSGSDLPVDAEVDSPPAAASARPPLPGREARATSGNLPVLEILSEGGQMRDGLLTLDAYEQDRVWMGIALETEAGSPIKGKAVTLVADGPAQIVTRQTETDEDGYFEFEVLVGPAGTQTVAVSAANVTREFRLNVIPNDFDQWLQGLPQEGLTRWNTLMEARVIASEDGTVTAEFPPSLQALSGKTVTLAGFMLPLEPSPEQRHFLLSASPPNCFFHVPGGPSTVIEVFADTPVMGSFDPLRVEGTLELVEASELGILFRLQKARPGSSR